MGIPGESAMPADPAAVKAVFLEVADLPPAARAGVLAERCGADADLLPQNMILHRDLGADRHP